MSQFSYLSLSLSFSLSLSLFLSLSLSLSLSFSFLSLTLGQGSYLSLLLVLFFPCLSLALFSLHFRHTLLLSEFLYNSLYLTLSLSLSLSLSHTPTHAHTYIHTYTRTLFSLFLAFYLVLISSLYIFSPIYFPVGWGCRIYQVHPCKEVRPHTPTSVPHMTLKCIQWWGSSPGVLRNVEYPFTVITPRSTLIRSGSTCLGQIYWLNRTF